MRWTASRISASVFALATLGLLTYAWTARAQLGGPGGGAPATEPVRALLQVDPPAGKEALDAVWQRTVNTHTAMLREQHLLRNVAASDEVHKTGWYGQFKGADADAKAAAALARVLIVRPVQDTELIEVKTSVEPPADAVVLTNTVCDQFLRKLADQEQARINRQMDALHSQLNVIKLELNEEVIKLERQRRLELGTEGIATPGRAGGEPVFNVLALEVQEVVRARTAAEKDVETAKRAGDGAAAQAGAAQKSALQDAEKRLDELNARRTQLLGQMGKVNEAMFELELLDERTTELLRSRNAVLEKLSTLDQAMRMAHPDVHIAAYAVAP